ncbi:MAG TPA: T9SS type A sorting domain-containing protein [Flavipsychrobacter sp.]|nr:T9SS type A sorting domain-containing protein [Flavipsychrobacter sp.]
MRKLLFLLFPVLLYAIPAKTQNMVPNGDFEYFDSCPTTIGQTHLAFPWRNYHLGSTDYFNTCAIHPNNATAPQTNFGYQSPASGNGFAGGYAFMTYITSTYSELLAIPIKPLITGRKYEVSLSINRSNNSGAASNGIGVYFYDNGPTNTITGTFSSHLSISPQINFTSYGVITDTQNWTRLVDTFTADSTYDNIVIGNFPMITSYTVIGAGYAYYYYDSVVIKYAKGITCNFNDSFLCAGQPFNIPYYLDTNYATFYSGNQFLVELSNSSGIFSSGTMIIGSVASTLSGNISCIIPTTITPGNNYKIRIRSTNTADTSYSTAQDISIGNIIPLKPIANSNSPVCSGSSINLSATTSTNFVSYKWTGPNNYLSYSQNPSIPISQLANSGGYVVSARLFGCESKDTVNISVIQSPYPVFTNNDTSICQNSQLLIYAHSSQLGVTYYWTGPNNFSDTNTSFSLSNLQTVNAGNYIVNVTLNGCSVTDTVNINVKPNPSKPVANVSGPICIGGTASFTVTSNTSVNSWQWTGPNNFSSALQYVILNNVQLNSAGPYIVRSTLQGCHNYDTTTLTIIDTSTISISSNSPVCIGDTIRLYSTPTNTSSYLWSGPNGYYSTTKDTYVLNADTAIAGAYYYAANYSGCTFHDTINIQVIPHPSNRVITLNSPICAGDTLNLNASSSSSNVTYTWTGPNNFVTTSQAVQMSNATTSQSGKYYINFLWSGCLTKDSINVTINPTPTAITASANTPLCENDTLRLNSTNSSTGVTWQWSGAAGYTSSAKDTFLSNAQISASGDYIVTATNSYNCKAKDTVNVLVKPLPANLSASVNTPVCAGTTLLLSATTTSSGTVFSWAGPNSFSSSIQNPNIPAATTSATGNYIVTATLNGCSVKDTVNAIVNALPATPVASANTPVCIGQDLMLNASTIPGATYQWINTASFSSLLQNPVIASAKTTDAGKYYVRSVMNNCYSPFDSVTVNVIPAPSISVYPSPKDSICQGAAVNFVSNNTNAGSSFIRTWYKNNNIIGGAANANYSTTTAADKDEYFVTLTTYGICATPYTDTSNKIIMKVLPWLTPSVSITANPNTTVISGTKINFTALAVNGGAKPAYQWTRNGTNITGALSNIWGASTLSNNDLICVDMTSDYMCPSPKSAKSNCIKVSIESTGVAHNWTDKEPKIHPNPTKEILVIEGLEKETKIQLNDVIGRVLYNQICNTTNTQINTANLVPGNYVLLLNTKDGNSMVVKIVKE